MAEIGKDIEKAKLLIEAGKLVAIPTDTVYGLAGDVMNESVLLKIFHVKNRPKNIPLITLSNSIQKLQKLTIFFSSLEMKLVKKFWPGALTVIVKKKSNVSQILTAGLDTLGVRIPAHCMATKLLKNLINPLAVTSANIYGKKSPKSAIEVEEQLGNRINYILDGGVCEVGKESTIIEIDSGKIKLHRQGAVPLEQLQHTLFNRL